MISPRAPYFLNIYILTCNAGNRWFDVHWQCCDVMFQYIQNSASIMPFVFVAKNTGYHVV